MRRDVCRGQRIRGARAGLSAVAVLVLLMGGCERKEPEEYRIGILGMTAFADMATGFKHGMNQAGHPAGRKFVYEMELVGADLAVSDNETIREFVDAGVDMIFAFPTEPTKAAKNGTMGTDIPVVFGFAGLEENDLIASTHRPGGNITGVRFSGAPVTAKRLEILMELAPLARRIGLFYDPAYPTAPPSLRLCRVTASLSNVTLVEIPVPDVGALKADIEERSKRDDVGMDAILTMPDILNNTPDGFGAILEFANQNDLPVGGGQLFMADAGALFAYGPVDSEVGELCAVLAQKVLQGIPAGDVPVATPVDHLVLNYRRAQELGMTVPDGLLGMAMRIIR